MTSDSAEPTNEALLHLCGAADWPTVDGTDTYSADSLATEGFIHCCTTSQLLGVIDRYYSDRTDLQLLVLDAQLVGSEILWEESPPNGTFPHVYGPIATAAVTAVLPMPRSGNGSFSLPTELL